MHAAQGEGGCPNACTVYKLMSVILSCCVQGGGQKWLKSCVGTKSMLPQSHPYNPSMEMYHLLLPLQPHSCLLSGAGCVSNSSVPPECHLQHSQLESSFFSVQTRLELNGNEPKHFLDHAATQDFATLTPVKVNFKFANLRPIIELASTCI